MDSEDAAASGDPGGASGIVNTNSTTSSAGSLIRAT